MLEITANAGAFAHLAAQLAAAGKRAPIAIGRAVKHTGGVTTTAVRRALPGQTELKPRTIQRAVKGAMIGSLSYAIRSRGGDISLKFFGPRETRAGASHRSPRRESPVAGSFTKGGRFPRRVAAKRLNGHVYKRAGGSKLPIVKQKSGVIIPQEMVTARAPRPSTARSRATCPAASPTNSPASSARLARGRGRRSFPGPRPHAGLGGPGVVSASQAAGAFAARGGILSLAKPKLGRKGPR